jgi:Carboxypeptidase regulatory-like domain
LTIQGPTIAFTPVQFITRRTEPIPAPGYASQHSPGFQKVYGPVFTLTAAPGRLVEGVVRDALTKKPMADVAVRSERFAGSNWVGIKDLSTRTDAQGRFRLVGLPKSRGNQLLIVPNDGQPFFMQKLDVPDPPGIAPVPVEIALHKGLWIQGQVSDRETGKPVEGAWMHYIPFLENTFAQATPEFGKHRNVDGTTYQDRYQTHADGSYRLVGLPGRAIVGMTSHSDKPYLRGAGSESIKGMDQEGAFPTYSNPVFAGRLFPTSMKEINPPDGTDVVRLDLELFRGAKARIRVVDPQGQPVIGVNVSGRIDQGRRDQEPQTDAEFDVVTLAPGEDRMVLVQHEGQKLGKVVHVHVGDDQKGPVIVTLEPLASITGRVTDPDGNPVSGATVGSQSHAQSPASFSLNLTQIATGDGGRFTLSNVPIGCDYLLYFEIPGVSRELRFARCNAKVRPGESTDVGEIRFKNE